MSNFWIISGLIAGVFATFALPYGFHLKAKEEQKNETKGNESFEVQGDAIAGDKVEGDKIVIDGNVNFSKESELDHASRIKIAKLRINREFEDFNHNSSEIYSSFLQDTDLLANKFNARGTLTSGLFIKAQMDLAQNTKDKIERLWLQMNRNIEDILINQFGQTSFDKMTNEFLVENNKRADLYEAKKSIYHMLEGVPESWEMKIFKQDNITKNFKLH